MLLTLRGWIKRLESFELLDGSRHYFDPLSSEIFSHWHKCLGKSAHDWPETLEVYKKLTQAKDVGHAFELLMGHIQGERPFFVSDPPDILINERRLVPRPLVSRYDPKAGKHAPVDPYEWELEDLSES